MFRSRFTHSLRDGLRPSARAGLLALLAAVLLGLGAAPEEAPAQGPLTTLFTTMDVPQKVSGVDSVPIGPSDLGTFRAAMAFTPTVSGRAQLLSVRGRCVIGGGGESALSCAGFGQVSIQSDNGGKPSGQMLAAMGYHVLESFAGGWKIMMTGNPTGGTFRLRWTNGSETLTTAAIPWNIRHRPRFNDPDRKSTLQYQLEAGGLPISVSSDGRFPRDPAYVSGEVEATDVKLTGGVKPGIRIAKMLSIEEECGRLSPAPQLQAGTKYWAVMASEDEIAWDDWTNTTAEVLESLNGAAWRTAFNPKTLALRIDAGSDTCTPVAVPNPDPGTTIGEMYVHSGHETFNTITFGNDGVAPLALGSASFTGTDAGVFSVKRSEPPAAAPFPFPRAMGVGGLQILYPTCTGGAAERWYRASVTFQTSDPVLPTVTYPVECLVDNTPPTVAFSGEPDGLAGWWRTSPITLGVIALDPESENRVKFLTCSDAHPEATWSHRAVFGGAMSPSVAGEGEHLARCSATDLAGNVSGDFPYTFKIDSRPPVVAATVSPSPNADGWNNSATSVTFPCNDPSPGSGVDQPATGDASVEIETAGTDVTSSGCTDVAGHVSTPVMVTVRLDMTSPVADRATVTPAPNAAGWNNSDATVSFECVETGDVQSGIKSAPPDVVVSDNTDGTTVTPTGDCVDKADNRTSTDASQRVRLDRTEPSTRIDSGPPGLTNVNSAQFALHAEDALAGVARIECRLDGGSFEPCASGKTYTDLADGEHMLRVRALDVADNADGSGVSWRWSVDTIAPETSLGSGPDAITSATSAAFAYSGDALGGSQVVGYECSLNGDAFDTCPRDGISYSDLADGEHTFRVRALDEAGNPDGSAASWTWTVDTIAPDTSVDSGPDAVTSATSAAFAYSGDAQGGSAVSGYECSLDGGAFAPCASGQADYSELAGGEHSFHVRGIDAAGNVDGSPATWMWTVDLVAPTTTITDGPESTTLGSTRDVCVPRGRRRRLDGRRIRLPSGRRSLRGLRQSGRARQGWLRACTASKSGPPTRSATSRAPRQRTRGRRCRSSRSTTTPRHSKTLQSRSTSWATM